MKQIVVKKGTQVCSRSLGGCGRTIKQGEVAYLQMRPRSRGTKRRYLCKECMERKSY